MSEKLVFRLGDHNFLPKNLGLDLLVYQAVGWIMGNVGLSQSRGHFQNCLFDKLDRVSKKPKQQQQQKKTAVLVMVIINTSYT